MCDDLLSYLAAANEVEVTDDKAKLERRRARLWARVFRDWDTDCRFQHPGDIEPREPFPVIKQPNPGFTMEQMRARAMAHWNRGEVQRVSQYNIELVVYWARRRLVKDVRISMVIAHPTIFTRASWLKILGKEENLTELRALGASEEFVRNSGLDVGESIGDLRHVDI